MCSLPAQDRLLPAEPPLQPETSPQESQSQAAEFGVLKWIVYSNRTPFPTQRQVEINNAGAGVG